MIKRYNKFLRENVGPEYDYYDEENEEDWIDITDPIVRVNKGDKVMCIADCNNNHHNVDIHGRLLIKTGEIKIVKGGTVCSKNYYKKNRLRVFFDDTPGGWGTFPAENFEKI